MIGGYQRI